jgi:hypothetical protein
MESFLIGGMTVEKHGDGVRLSCTVDSPGFPRELWYLIKGIEPADIRQGLYNWAAAGLLFPAMFHGRDIVIQGRVSRKLFTSINLDMQTILRIYYPKLQRIRLRTEGVSDEHFGKRRARVATGFSAGIDSFATLSIFSPENHEIGIHVTDLCTFNVGAMGRFGAPGVNELFGRYRERTDAYAGSHGLGAISVDSNLDEFYRDFNFQRTHTLRNASAALTLEGVIDHYLYSSAYDLTAIGIRESTNMAGMDPIVLPMICTENLSFMSAGAGLSRFQKTAQVAQFAPAQELLDVCVEPARERVLRSHPNCSRCWKCRRTLITLEALNAVDRFHRVFDLDHYRRNKAAMHADLVVNALSGNALDMEVLKNMGRDPQDYGYMTSLKVFGKTARARWKQLFRA